jgi:hypothetical protein
MVGLGKVSLTEDKVMNHSLAWHWHFRRSRSRLWSDAWGWATDATVVVTVVGVFLWMVATL